MICCWLLIAFRPPGEWKMCENHWFLWVKMNMRVFVLWCLLTSILDPKIVSGRPKIGPKSAPGVDPGAIFCFRIQVAPIFTENVPSMAPTWAQLEPREAQVGAQVGAMFGTFSVKMGATWIRKQKIAPGSALGIDFGSILGCPEPILDWFWSAWSRFWMDFW